MSSRLASPQSSAVLEALTIRREVFGNTHDRTLATRLLAAESRLVHRLSPEDVLTEVTEVRGLREAALGIDHPSTLEALLLEAKAALRSGKSESALRLAEDTLTRREQMQRPPGELTAARVVVAQAAAASGKVDRAREVAASISFDGPPASELRGWCDPCEDEMQRLASAR